MTDLVERLREDADRFMAVGGDMFLDPDFCETDVFGGPLLTAAEWTELSTRIHKAADRITALEAEIARKDALMEKAVQAGLDAAEQWLKSTKNKINVTNWTEFNDPHRLTYVTLEQTEFAIRALSASEIVKEMCGA